MCRSIVTLVVVCSLTILISCSSTYRPSFSEAPESRVVNTTQVAYPIILLHGLGQKSHVWDGSAIRFYEQEMGLKFGGVLSMNGSQVQVQGSSSGTRDFYTVSFSNATDSVGAWGWELEQYINKVLELSQAQKVILIGYSMGGLASRYYLTHHVNNHHVKRLITIGTPHMGSAFARVYAVKTAITSRLAQQPNIITATALKAALSALTACESDVAFDAPALHDLMRPEDGGVFLDYMGKTEHPADVEYVSVVGDVDVLGEASKLSSAAVQEMLRRTMEFFDSGIPALFQSGDGVVSVQSQMMTNIPWFRNNPRHQRLARTVNLSSVHTAHLQNSNEIQRVTLEDRPEFKGAEFVRINNASYLMIDFSDYLPVSKSTVTVSYNTLAGEKKVIATDMRLVRSADGSVVCRAFVNVDDADFERNFTAAITISNYFSNSATASKSWTRP